MVDLTARYVKIKLNTQWSQEPKFAIHGYVFYKKYIALSESVHARSDCTFYEI